MQEKQPCVYLLANKPYGTLYLGVTSNLKQRICQHKEKVADGFSSQYGVDKLVWFELHDNMESAISREKNIKSWKRDWKIQLINKENLGWHDLYNGLF